MWGENDPKHPPTIVSNFLEQSRQPIVHKFRISNLVDTINLGKIVPQDLNLDPICFSEQPKQKVCFGRNRIRNRKRFFHFGKIEFRQKWPKFGQTPKPNLFRSYTTSTTYLGTFSNSTSKVPSALYYLLFLIECCYQKIPENQ